MIKLGELVMILELHRQGLSVSAIARQLGIDRKTVRVTSPRAWRRRLQERPPRRRSSILRAVFARADRRVSGLTGARLRELHERGYQGGYTAVTDLLRELRPRAAGL